MTANRRHGRQRVAAVNRSAAGGRGMRSTPGAVFGLTVRGVRVLPRRVSYAIGHVGTWLAWRLMRETTAAVAANLQPLFPDDSRGARAPRSRHLPQLRRRHDRFFAGAVGVSRRGTTPVRSASGERAAIFERVSRAGRGALLVAGHFGNWEIGGILMGRVLTAADDCRDAGSRSRGAAAARRNARGHGCRNAGSAAVARHRAADPPDARRQSPRRLAGRSPCRPRPRRGDVSWARAWFLQSPACSVSHGRAADSVFSERLGPGLFTTIALEPIYVDRNLPRRRRWSGRRNRWPTGSNRASG